MKNSYSKSKGSIMIKTEFVYHLNCIEKKLIFLAFFICIIMCLSSCNKYAQEETLMVEEQGVEYYFVGEEGDYSFKKAFLTVYPNETIQKEIVENKADLTITRKSEDEWTVYHEDMVPDYSIDGEKIHFRESHGFSCVGDISEESVVRGRTFHDDMKDYHYITTGFISIDEIKEIVNNGQRISDELNEQSGK